MSTPRPGKVIGQAIKALRERQGWSQETAVRRMQAVGLDWKPYQLGDLESGRRQDLNVSELLLLAEAFGVRAADLLHGAGPVQMSNDERPLHVARSMLSGELAPNSDLFGPTDIPGFGSGPYWSRAGDGQGQIFSGAEVRLARWLGLDVTAVHEVMEQTGLEARRVERGLLSDAQFGRLAGALARLAKDMPVTAENVKLRIVA